MSLVLIIFLPLLSSIICGLLRNALSQKVAGIVASLIISIVAVLAINIFIESVSNPYLQHLVLFNWIRAESLNINWAIYADNLTVIMYVIISVISAVVHVYSIGYMRDDPRFNTFMAYLSLFTFFMLMLVSADNLIQMFFGWEGVGLCSYLLIGFWYTKESAIQAAKKAFIVNRFADVALMLGILIIYYKYQSFNFADLQLKKNLLMQTSVELMGHDFSLLDITCLLIFVGCMGKSAQLGLHVWLPDAMEGPTPVSALIHAATMVTAGVFLVARLYFLFEQSEPVSFFIAFIGSLTCFIAASIAILQTDIKKIIAYSTCSQLGYMFMACGLKAYHAAIFHLATHAFYKAALFLSAGNVIHGTGYQELDQIGNVRAKMKFTFCFFMIASAAIMGIPPFAGFYSKDLILEYAHMYEALCFILGIMAAFYTGFYSTKILGKIFIGSNNVNSHAHEADLVMLLPIMVLMVGAIASGYFGIHAMHIDEPTGYFSHIFKIIPPAEGVSVYIKNAPLISVILGGIIGYLSRNNDISRSRSLLFRLAQNRFYFDEIYDRLIVAPLEVLSTCAALFDTYVIDQLGPKNLVSATHYLSQKISKYHTGYIFTYGLWISLSVLCITVYFIIRF